jgi:hypothetical protein
VGYSNMSNNSYSASSPDGTPRSQPATAARRAPRVTLLATLLFNPIILVGYYLYLYGPGNTCVAGSVICSFGNDAAIVQIVIIVAACAAIWLLLSLLARWLVEARYGERNVLVRSLRALTNTSSIRPLLLIYGLLLLAGVVISFLKRELSPPIAALSLFTVFACLHSAWESSSPEGGMPG